MEYLEFKEELKKELRKSFPDYEIEEIAEDKLAVRVPGNKVAPMLKVDEIYKRDKSVNRELMEALIHSVENGIEKMPNIDIEELINWEEMKKRIFIRLMPAYKVEDDFISFPVTENVDAVVAAKVDGVFNVKKGFGLPWEKSEEEIIEMAKANRGNEAGTIEEMLQKLMKMKDIEIDHEIQAIWQQIEGMEASEKQYVVTNSSGVLGAGCILQPEVQRELEKIFGNKFAIIPSSVHEVVVKSYPEDDDEVSDLNRCIMETNSGMDPRDILSNRLMVYERGVIREV